MTGRLLALEGGEGSGKSTQAPRLAARLRAEGHEVVETHEPGATVVGREIRRVLLDGGDVDALAETLLLAADRAEHVRRVIEPALAAGLWVLTDRYVPSSLAYQGVARGVGVERVAELNRWVTGGRDADVVVVLDVPDGVAAARRPSATDRMEREDAGFHARVRAAYRDLSVEHGWLLVDGTGTPDEVEARVWSAIVGATGLSAARRSAPPA